MDMPLSLVNVSSYDAQASRRKHLENINLDLERAEADIKSVIEQVESVREDLYGEGNGASNYNTSDFSLRRRSLFCCCCRRRDLRRLEDRLWERLHLLQEKENELHRQKTAILSRVPTPAGEPPQGQMPPSVSPDAPASPLWQNHHKTTHTTTTTNTHHHQQQRRTSEQHQQPFRYDDQQQPTANNTSSSSSNSSSTRPLLADFNHPNSTSSESTLAATYQHASLPVAQLLQAAAAAAASGAQQVPVQSLPPRPPLSIRRRPNRPGSAEDTGSGAE